MQIDDRNPLLRRPRKVAAAVVAVVLAVFAGVLVASRGDKLAPPSSTATSSCRSDTTTDPGSSHVQNPSYAVNPPSGGDHDPVPAPAGTYATPGIVPADGQLVHSMEHGFVVVWYRPGLAAADMSALTDVVGLFSRDVLLVPRASLPVREAATAWHQRLLCDRVEAAELSRFVDDGRNQGPERIPH